MPGPPLYFRASQSDATDRARSSSYFQTSINQCHSVDSEMYILSHGLNPENLAGAGRVSHEPWELCTHT